MTYIERKIFLILFILFSELCFCQNINQISAIESVSKLQKISKMQQKKLKWNDTEIYGEYENGFTLIEGILKNDTIVKYFGVNDLKFIEKQYQNKTDNLWKTKFKKVEILDSLRISALNKQAIKTLKMKYYYHSVSEPLFSENGNLMIIKVNYFCGFMCSTQCIYLYRKKNKSWKLITEWNCLAS